MVRNLKDVPQTREGMEALWNFFATSRRKKLWHRLLNSKSDLALNGSITHEFCRSYVRSLIENRSLRKLSLNEIEIAAFSLMQGHILLLNNVVEPPIDEPILSRCDCTYCTVMETAELDNECRETRVFDR